MALLTGRLRRQYDSDVRKFGDVHDATIQVAAGYICLAAALAQTIGLLTVLTVNPAHIEAHILAAISIAGCFHGFRHIRRRQDPRPVMEWLVLLHLVIVAIISFRHAGIVAPIVASLPAAAVIAALFMRPRMRLIALGLGLAVALAVVAFASGVAGVRSPYSEQTQSVMGVLTLGLSTIALGGIAWLTNLSRDFALDRLGEANAKIVESAAHSRIALEAAKVGLWDVPNADLRKFHISESLQSVTGYSADEFNDVFGALDRFVHPDDIVRLREAFAVGRERSSRLRVDFRLNTKAQGYRWFSALARYSRNPDGTRRISGSLQDISFMKAAEEALRTGRDQARRASKAKSDFIAVMSHEVRTPLNAILGSVEVLKDRELDREAAELVSLIDDAGRGLLTIVDDLLDVSRVEAGKLDIALSPTDPCALIRRTVDFWRAQATDKGLSLEADCGDALPGVFMLDAGRVRQIIGNLVSNAIKFTDVGCITASLSISARPDSRVDIIIDVKDTGRGVPATIAEKIFAPFEQGPNDASRGGAGLGLYISRRLARLMGGDLVLESGGDPGSHFRLTLAADRALETDLEEFARREEPVWNGRRVLCIDDNDHNRRIAELLLRKFGVDVQACASGAEAIDLCGMEKFDAILLDIVMPDMDGFETLQRLRNDPGCLNRSTPAIALTAKLSAGDLAKYNAGGFDGIAGKPIDLRQLAQTIAPFMAPRAEEASHADPSCRLPG